MRSKAGMAKQTKESPLVGWLVGWLRSHITTLMMETHCLRNVGFYKSVPEKTSLNFSAVKTSRHMTYTLYTFVRCFVYFICSNTQLKFIIV